LIRAHDIFGDLSRFGRQFYTPAQFKRNADRSPRARPTAGSACRFPLRSDLGFQLRSDPADDDFGVRRSSSFEVSPAGFAANPELFLKRKLSFPVPRVWQRWVRRSSRAVVISGSPNDRSGPLRRGDVGYGPARGGGHKAWRARGPIGRYLQPFRWMSRLFLPEQSECWADGMPMADPKPIRYWIVDAPPLGTVALPDRDDIGFGVTAHSG
jgi:hypothetical protein